MRRKRKTRYQWFDQIGTVGPTANVEDDFSGIEQVILVPALTAVTAIGITDYIPDYPAEENPMALPPTAGAPTLGMLSRNEYFIRRIVGNCFASVGQSAANQIPAVFVTVGMFIARCDDHDINANLLPVGGTTPGGAGQVDNYSPIRCENIKEPWIWRRSWILGNNLSTNAETTGLRNYPQTNAGYGSMSEGTKVDAKTARRVRDGERLYIVTAAKRLPLNATDATDVSIRVIHDYRILGAMRKSHNRSVF